MTTLTAKIPPAQSTRVVKPAPDPGIYHGVPFSEYAAWKAWNPSTVKILLSDSPMAMRHTIDHGRESTESMDLGRAEHCCVLEPVRVEQTYAIVPAFHRDPANVTVDGKPSTMTTTKYVKEKRAAFAKENPGKELIEADEYEACLTMRRSIYNHAAASELLTGQLGNAEVSIVWIDKQTGLVCKGRIDWLDILMRLTDLKTTVNPQPWAFISQATRLQYHVSMGAYSAGLEALGKPVSSAHFIAVGNKPWHDVVRFDLADSVLRVGREQWHVGLQRIAHCIKTNSWPGIAAEPFPFELPAWSLGESDVELEVASA